VTAQNSAQEDATREAIQELVSTGKIELYLDIALDAIAHTLLGDRRFQRLGLDKAKSGIGDVLAALVKNKLIPADANGLPKDFEEAVEQVLYPGGEYQEKRLREVAAKLHKYLSTAIDRLEADPGVAGPAPPAR
jgi:hypothetical protein